MSHRRGSVKPREIDVLKRKLGLRFVDCKHHIRLYFEVNGTVICATHMSFGRDDIYGRILNKMAKDLEMQLDLFFGIIDCHKELADYLEHLSARRII